MKVQIGREKKDFLTNKMFGMFFEDINYAGDGGLYAEMIENRQFAFRKAVCRREPTTPPMQGTMAGSNTPPGKMPGCS